MKTLFKLGCLFLLSLVGIAPQVYGKGDSKVTVYTGSQSSLTDRWEWGQKQRKDKGFTWVGYSVTRSMPANEFFQMRNGRHLYITGIVYGTQNSLNTYLNEPDLNIPEDSLLQNDIRMAIQNIHGNSHGQKSKAPQVEKQIAILMGFSGNNRSGDADSLICMTTDLPFESIASGLVWLGESTNTESLAFLKATYPRLKLEASRAILVRSLAFHDAEPQLVLPFLEDRLHKREALKIRQAAVKALGNMQHPRSLELLKTVVDANPNEGIGRDAVESIATLTIPGSLEALLGYAKKSASRDIRREAVESLGERDEPSAAVALKQILFEDKDVHVQDEALEALLENRPRTNWQPLIQEVLEQHPAEDIREEAVEYLAYLPLEASLPILRKTLLEDPSHGVQDECLDVLGSLKNKAGVSLLIETFQNHPNEDIREEALENLAQVAVEDAARLASQTLLSKEELSLKMSALRALEDLPENRGVPQIIEISRNHPNVKLRQAAIRMLGDSEDPRAWKALLALVGNRS